MQTQCGSTACVIYVVWFYDVSGSLVSDELLWSVDPVSRSVGQPQSITDTLGIPSPIDTVFTRCNCHGNTYIIKV